MKVSVLIPIYNAAKNGWLERCFDSLAAQTLGGVGDIEFICINDGSTDGSLDIIKDYAGRDPRFVLLDKENGGYGQGLNRGLEIATGEYIGIVEPDDFVDPDMYEVLYGRAQELAEAGQLVDIVKSAYWRETTDGYTLPCFYMGKPKYKTGVFTLEQDTTLFEQHPSIWTCIYRRAFLDGTAADGSTFPPIRLREFPGAGWADNPFLVETFCRAAAISYVDRAFYHYFEDGPESSSGMLKNVHLPFDRWIDMDDLVKELGITAPNILEVHYARGMNYMQHVVERCDLSDPTNAREFDERCKEMFARMDKDLFMHSGMLSKRDKRLYLSKLGLPEEHIDNSAFLKRNLANRWQMLRVGGLRYAYRRVGKVVRRNVIIRRETRESRAGAAASTQAQDPKE